MMFFMIGCETPDNHETITETDPSNVNTPDCISTELYYSVIIVDTPVFCQVTNQIPRSIIGKYTTENPDEFFEIRNDGSFTVSLNAMEGYAVYTEKDAYIVAYYEENIRCTITFILKTGYGYTFPSSSVAIKFQSADGDACTEKTAQIFDGYDGEYQKVNG